MKQLTLISISLHFQCFKLISSGHVFHVLLTNAHSLISVIGKLFSPGWLIIPFDVTFLDVLGAGWLWLVEKGQMSLKIDFEEEVG